MLGEHDVTVETETMIKIVMLAIVIAINHFNLQERNIVYKLRHEAYDYNTLKNDIGGNILGVSREILRTNYLL